MPESMNQGEIESMSGAVSSISVVDGFGIVIYVFDRSVINSEFKVIEDALLMSKHSGEILLWF